VLFGNLKSKIDNERHQRSRKAMKPEDGGRDNCKHQYGIHKVKRFDGSSDAQYLFDGMVRGLITV